MSNQEIRVVPRLRQSLIWGMAFLLCAMLLQAAPAQLDPCLINPCGNGCPGRDCNPLCGGNPCGVGCPDRCTPVLCEITWACDPACGGNPCFAECFCWADCETTRCTPICGGNRCASGCPDECDPIICPLSFCNPTCNWQHYCNPLCGGNPCNSGCPAACGCPGSKCFNVEIDYMVDTDHTHKPNQSEIDAVVQMFACQGYTLNVVIDDQIPHYDVMVRDPTCLIFFEYNAEPNTFGALKAEYFDNAFTPGWHYAIFGHDYEGANCQVTGSSGLAERPGNDFVVTLGQFSGQAGTPFDRAATFAHEFGHNLGLDHCGNNDPGGIFEGGCLNVGNFVPIVPSIMDYFYQLTGVRNNLVCQGLAPADAAHFKHIDYSHGSMCTLNEAALDENFGTGMVSVDWNCSGAVGGIVAKDISGNSNGWCGANGGLQALSDLDEWSFIGSGLRRPANDNMDYMPLAECVTAQEVAELARAGGCPQPTLTTESCSTTTGYYLDATVGSNGDGKCNAPFKDVQSAYNASPNGSALFFKAGTYAPSGPIIMDKPLKLFAVPTNTQGSAVIQPP